MEEFEMDPYYKTLVLNAQTGGFTSQDLLESDLSMLGQYRQHIRNSLAHIELFDGVETRIAEFQEIDANDPDLFLNAELSNFKDNHAEAATLLDDCGFGYNDEQFCEALRQITLAERDADDCNEPHGAPLQSIEIIATNPEHLGNSLARAYLEEKSIGSWESDLHPSIIVRFALDQSSFSGQIRTSIIEVQPNPSNEIVRFICKLPEGMGTAEIRIFDSQMRLFHILQVGSEISINEMSTSILSSGIYFFQLYNESTQLEAGKWRILH